VFNAMRYAPEGPRAPDRVETPTVRLSFAIAAPFYPYTEAPPAPVAEQAFMMSARGPSRPRALDVFVVASEELEGRAGGAHAGPATVARAEVPSASLADALGGGAGWGFDPRARAKWTVTRMHEEVYRRTAFEDLVFEPPSAPSTAVGGSEDEGGAPKSALAWAIVLAAVAVGLAITLASDAEEVKR
jgi:hypothetical protein